MAQCSLLPLHEDRLARDASRGTSGCCSPPSKAQIPAEMVAAATGRSHATVHTNNHHKPQAVGADSLPLPCPLGRHRPSRWAYTSII